MPNDPLLPQDNTELDAIAEQNMETNEKLGSIDVNTEAGVIQQKETTDAVRDLETPLEAIAIKSAEQVEETRKSATTISQAVKDGSVADIFISSMMSSLIDTIKGDKGDKGDKGEKGDRGDDGKDGRDGRDGKDGKDGKDSTVPGPKGDKGAPGIAGKDGKDGKDGKPGKDGKDASESKIKKAVSEAVLNETQKVINKEFTNIRHSVSSKTYSVGELENMSSATTGQTPVKQADGTWAPGDATGDSLPDQTGNSGKYLTTDGTDASWATLTGGGDMAAATYDPAGKSEQLLGVSDILDEDNMSSDSATKVPSQQSVKAYVDGQDHYATSDFTTDFAAEDLANLSTKEADDLDATGITDGYVLKADGSGGTAWEAESGGGGGGAVDSVNGQTGTVVLDPDDLDDTSTTNKFTTAAEISKLAGIEASADVTDTANVTAAGALMDSEVTNLADVKAFDPADYATAAQGTTADNALQPTDIASGTITPRADDVDLSGGDDGDVLTVQADGSLALETPAGGQDWSDPVDADIVPDGDSTRDVGSSSAYFAEGYFDTLYFRNTRGQITALGNLGTTEAIDFSGNGFQYGTLDDDVTITFSNEAEGASMTLLLLYDASSQRTITWSDVDVWLNGSAPTAPSSASDPLIVTLLRINSVTYASHNKGVGSGGSSDHGALSGLSDDDHTQYAIISSGSGAPGTTPSRVGAVYVDTDDDNVYIATGTASSDDWTQVDGTGGATDHGALTGLTDDDHTQYTIISSGAGAPGSTPARVGALYADTSNNRVFVAFGTSDYNDWRYMGTTANPYVPSEGDALTKSDGSTAITKTDGSTTINKTG